jgi:transposase-like protein
MFTNLRELVLSMPTEETCREYLVQQRWQGKPVCPYCGSGRVYSIEKGKRFKCGNSECYKKFSATVGTIFEASNIPLSKWFLAVYISTAHKKGISSYQLGKDVGVTQKTGWFMLHRIREMMRTKHETKLDNIVEIDETFVGGKVKNMSKKRRASLRTENNGTVQNKVMVIGMLERGGNLKLVAMAKETGMAVVQPIVRDNVDNDAVLITDSSANYEGLNKEYAGHEIINHSNDEYVRDGVIHTNSIEGAFSWLKRSIIGIYHQVTPKHLSRYCDETMYKYNSRQMKDSDRFTLSLQNVEGRLTYKELVKKAETHEIEYADYTDVNIHKGKPVIQYTKNGEMVAKYSSINNAEQMTGIKSRGISKVVRGFKNSYGGFIWKYA